MKKELKTTTSRKGCKINYVGIFKKSLYIILPILFFSVWYCVCSFITLIWIPSEMSEYQRYAISVFGLISSIIGVYLSVDINDN